MKTFNKTATFGFLLPPKTSRLRSWCWVIPFLVSRIIVSFTNWTINLERAYTLLILYPRSWTHLVFVIFLNLFGYFLIILLCCIIEVHPLFSSDFNLCLWRAWLSLFSWLPFHGFGSRSLMNSKVVRFSGIFKAFFKLIFKLTIPKIHRVDIMLTFIALSPHFFHLEIVGSQIRSMLIDFNWTFCVNSIKAHFLQLSKHIVISFYEIYADFDSFHWYRVFGK